MEKLTELLMQMRKRPRMYLGKPSLELFKIFISGYIICKREYDPQAEVYPGFQQFIEAKYDREGTAHFVTIIRETVETDEEAFYKFFDLLDEFLEKQNK